MEQNDISYSFIMKNSFYIINKFELFFDEISKDISNHLKRKVVKTLSKDINNIVEYRISKDYSSVDLFVRQPDVGFEDREFLYATIDLVNMHLIFNDSDDTVADINEDIYNNELAMDKLKNERKSIESDIKRILLKKQEGDLITACYSYFNKNYMNNMRNERVNIINKMENITKENSLLKIYKIAIEDKRIKNEISKIIIDRFFDFAAIKLTKTKLITKE